MLPSSVVRPSLVCALVLGGVFGAGTQAVAAPGSGGALAAPTTTPAAAQHLHPAGSGGMSADADSSSGAPAASGGAPAMAGTLATPAQRVALTNLPFRTLIVTAARRHAVPPTLLAALVWQESGFRADARSGAGARGLTQLMPGTARDLGVRRIDDPAENLDGGARYLKALLMRFGSTSLALAAYNAGPNAVVRHAGIPPYRETRQYVRSVLGLEARLRASGSR